MDRTARFLLCFLTILTLIVVVSPGKSLAGDAWLPIAPEDLALKDNPASPGAAAMILYRESNVNEKYTDEDGAYVDEYVRVKIFTQEGTKWADVEVPFVKEYSDVKDVRARTIHPDGSIMEFQGKPFEKTIEKLSGTIFLAKTFTLPEVTPGSIIEYRYRLQHKPYWIHDENWTISGELFTRDARFTIVPFVPRSYEGNFPLYFRVRALPPSDMPKQQPDGSYLMVVHDIPGLEDEPLMPPRQALESRVEFFHRDSEAPSSETADQFWARTGKKWNGEMERFINKKSALEGEVSRIVAAGDSPETKLRKIYERCQKVRDLSDENVINAKEMKEAKLKPAANVEDVLTRGYANSRQTNFLFVGLARAAGFEATEIYLAPRNSNFFYPQLQDASEIDEDDIAWVKAGDKEYFLDPAARAFPFPLLPWYETMTSGMKLTKQGGQTVTTPPPQPEEASTLRRANLQINDDGVGVGTLEVEFRGRAAAGYREAYHKEDEAGRKKKFEEIVEQWVPSGSKFELTKVTDWDNNAAALRIEGTLEVSGVGSPAGHRLLAPATIFNTWYFQDFEPAKRSNNILFPYPSQFTDDVTYRAPDGYKIESVPADRPAKTDSVMTYGRTTMKQENGVEIKNVFTQSGVAYEVKYYGAMRAFFSSMKSDGSAQIVFEAANANKGN
ncbi:MAG: DUF3857 domain-containing protein [Candidatus Acidiferrales bacterium]